MNKLLPTPLLPTGRQRSLPPGLGGPDEVYIDGMPARFVLQLHMERHDLHVAPACRLPTHLPASLDPRGQERLPRRPRHHRPMQYGFYMKSSSSGSGAGGMNAGMREAGSGYASPRSELASLRPGQCRVQWRQRRQHPDGYCGQRVGGIHPHDRGVVHSLSGGERLPEGEET